MKTTRQRLQELAAINNPFNEDVNEITYSDADKDALKGAFDTMQNRPGDRQKKRDAHFTIEGIKDGYYALTDNLPDLISKLEEAIKIHAAELPRNMDQAKALQKELKIMKDIQTLLDGSVIGAIL